MAEEPVSHSRETVVVIKTTRFPHRDLDLIEARILAERKNGVVHIHYSNGHRAVIELSEKEKHLK